MSDPLNPSAQDPASTGAAANEGWTTTPPADAAGRVAFCQDCGKPLTAETVRPVGTAMFCEPCLTARVGVPNPAAGVPPAGGIPVPLAPAFGEASPVLAGFLGLIPGVGAMYNGQYSKGFAHLIIFVGLDALAKSVSSVFHIFVLAWICYQVFDAYHTAKARNEGLPLPNVFGLNDIGERMGFNKGAAAAGASWTGPRPPVAGWQAPPPAYPVTPLYPEGAPVPSGPDWVGYVPPTNFASATPPVPPVAGYAGTPYANTFVSGNPANPYAAVPPVAPLPTVMARKRFPAGAIWLIALGLLILLANLVPDWKITERWWSPVLFAGLAVWLFLRRLHSGARLLTILRAPVVLLALAIMFALHAADIYVNFGMVCAIVLIVLGALLLLERTIGATYTYTPADTPRVSFVPAQDYTAAPPNPVDNDATKGGQ